VGRGGQERSDAGPLPRPGGTAPPRRLTALSVDGHGPGLPQSRCQSSTAPSTSRSASTRSMWRKSQARRRGTSTAYQVERSRGVVVC
jgi:hypothetical protein